MRDLKFRAWDGKKMIEPCVNMLIQSSNGYPFWQFGFNEPDPMFGTIVMQFTGLKDKNGKEIYDGDVVRAWGRHNDCEYTPFIVEWGNQEDSDIGNDATGFNVGADLYYEVIGNIYENPELLNSNK